MLQWSNYLLISLFPVSIYWSMRRFGFDRIISAKGALVSSLATTNGLYYFDFRSYLDLAGMEMTFVGGKRDHCPAASSWLDSDLPAAKQFPLVTFGDAPK